MANRTLQRLAIITLCLVVLTACSGDRWNGGKYEGDVTINGTKPSDSKPEKFTIETGKTKRYVRMDAANKYVANCDIPIDDQYTAGITDDSLFFFDKKSAVCSGMTIHSGSVDLKGNAATVSVIGTAADGTSYTIHINGIRK